jgi:hypothetical protein
LLLSIVKNRLPLKLRGITSSILTLFDPSKIEQAT